MTPEYSTGSYFPPGGESAVEEALLQYPSWLIQSKDAGNNTTYVQKRANGQPTNYYNEPADYGWNVDCEGFVTVPLGENGLGDGVNFGISIACDAYRNPQNAAEILVSIKNFGFEISPREDWGDCVGGQCRLLGPGEGTGSPSKAICEYLCSIPPFGTPRFLCSASGCFALSDAPESMGFASLEECRTGCADDDTPPDEPPPVGPFQYSYCVKGALDWSGEYVFHGFDFGLRPQYRRDETHWLGYNIINHAWVFSANGDTGTPRYHGFSPGDPDTVPFWLEESAPDEPVIVVTGMNVTKGHCGVNVGCSLLLDLAYEAVTGLTGRTHRVTATLRGASGVAPISFSTPSGDLRNETGNTVLVNVPAGQTLVVTARAKDEANCSATSVITIDGDRETGESSCLVNVFLEVVDKGDGQYRVIATPANASKLATVSFFADAVPTPPDAGKNLQWTLTVPLGQSRQIVALIKDGDCSDATTLTISNADTDGAPPTAPIEGDCIERLGIYYRDIVNSTTVPDSVINAARFGLEVRDLCPNPGCHYWFQEFTSSDLALRDDFSESAMAQFFPVPPGSGQRYAADGNRIGRYQVQNGAISRPATPDVILRLKATPVFQKVPFTLDGNATKIRDAGARSLFVFQTGPAKARLWTAPEKGKYGEGSISLLKDLASVNAAGATDAALLDDKLYAIVDGGIIAVDLTQNEETLDIGIRGETRAPVWVEVVGGKPLAIYQDNAANPKVRCYDLSFPAPKLVWKLGSLITQTQVAAGKLLLACGSSLYVSNAGTAEPILDSTFTDSTAAISSLATGYVGLSNGHIYRKLSGRWSDRTTLASPVKALWPWLGGAKEVRALAGEATSNVLRHEQTTLNWTPDIELDGTGGVLALRALSIETTSATATNPAITDEWMLIGDDHSSLWVYSRSALSEADGAFKACHVAAPRIVSTLRPTTPSQV
jgi:hypothetical protein